MHKKIYKNEYGLPHIIAGIVFILAGIVIGIYVYQEVQTFMKKAVETSATITDIKLTGKGYKVGQRHKVMVTFKTDNGSMQTAQLDYYVITMKVGDVVEIKYDPDKPFKIMTGSPSQKGLLAGGIVILIGFVLFISGFFGLKQKSAWEHLRMEGVRYNADIVDCIMSGKRKAYTLSCRYTDEKGDTHICKSPDLSYDPREYITDKVIVYTDASNYKKYFMDIKRSMNYST